MKVEKESILGPLSGNLGQELKKKTVVTRDCRGIFIQCKATQHSKSNRLLLLNNNMDRSHRQNVE